MTGWSLFITPPGEADAMECRVCSSIMTVERNVMGPTGFAAGLSGHKSLHDEFRCPHSREGWHKQALKILVLVEETPSAEIAKILKAEADEIINKRRPTKPEYE